MDTKLKKFSVGTGMQVLAFFLCILFFIGTLASVGFMAKSADLAYSRINLEESDVFLNKNYEESLTFQREFSSKLDTMLYILEEYQSEESIREGKTISQQEWDNEIEWLFREKYDSGEFEVEEDIYYSDEAFASAQARFMEEYAEELNALKQRMITSELRNLDSSFKNLEEKGFTYYATDGTYVITNMKDNDADISAAEFKAKPAYFVYENDQLAKMPVSSGEMATSRYDSASYFDRDFQWRLQDKYNEKLKVYFAFDQSYIDGKAAIFDQAKDQIFKWLPIAAICVIGTLITFIFLIVNTGRKDEEGNRTVHRIDNIFTEIQLAIIATCFFGGGYLAFELFLDVIRYGISYSGHIIINTMPLALSVALASLVGLIAAGVGLLFILSCVRNLKAGRFLRNCLIVKIILVIWNGITGIYHGGSVMTKVVLVAIGISLLSASVIGAPFIILLIIIFAPKWVNKYNEIKKGVEEVRSGNLSYKIPLEGRGELEELAKGINEISQASSIAVQNELKNQRLRTDLISNVSHDLKTPLTSIITYVDLLKREGLDSEDAPNYLDILDQKSQRLQKLTEDLFDAAKASSGAIPVRFEKVEMLSLINQGLGEMADRIDASGLEFKINAQEEKYYVRGDGQLLWRVVENLLSNVLKYALEGSRVYIDLRDTGSENGSYGSNGNGDMIVLEIKNISRTALNIDEEELMERFKRGDESRTTEGSGLGLAIAKDLVRIQKGWFEIKIDGDLFKAIVMLPKHEN